jgi:hypothetical protein
MDDLFVRFSSDLLERMHGPLMFRLMLQPVMAIIYAVSDGLNDAHEGRPAYFWSVLTMPVERRTPGGEGRHAVARVFLLGAVMDAIYQLIVFRRIYPGDLLVVVLLLAIVPYVVLRGPSNGIARVLTTGRIRA